MDSNTGLGSDWADFTIPPPFSSKVRSALRAEARSVKLSTLVGAGGLWYGFGKKIMDMFVDNSALQAMQRLTSQQVRRRPGSRDVGSADKGLSYRAEECPCLILSHNQT